MAKLADLTGFLDIELRIHEVPDYPGAHNGLQLQNDGVVTKVAAAVDASLPVVELAVEAGADLLIVHHGMFWQGARAITGAYHRKIKIALEGGLAIYSAHIPLDIHPSWGNNVLLAEGLGVGEQSPFFDWKGINLGIAGSLELTLGELKERLSLLVQGPVLLRGKESDQIGRLGIITGGAGSEVEAISAQGINTFITGEGPHWSHPLAEELGLNVLYAGHYATETFGVKRLACELEKTFRIPHCFVDYPTGL